MDIGCDELRRWETTSDRKAAAQGKWRLSQDKADLKTWDKAQEKIKELKSKSEKGKPEDRDE